MNILRNISNMSRLLEIGSRLTTDRGQNARIRFRVNEFCTRLLSSFEDASHNQ